MKKTALITGASTGFGYEFVKLFAKDNYDLILVARSIDKLEKIKREFEENKITVIQLTHYVLQDMKQRGGGKILNVASTAAFQPGPLMAVYYATKAYVLSLSEALVEELKGSNITVTTLCPGPSRTNFAKAANIEKTKLFAKVMDADAVARIGYNALMRGRRVVITGTLNKFAACASKFLPRSYIAKIVKGISREN